MFVHYHMSLSHVHSCACWLLHPCCLLILHPLLSQLVHVPRSLRRPLWVTSRWLGVVCQARCYSAWCVHIDHLVHFRSLCVLLTCNQVASLKVLRCLNHWLSVFFPGCMHAAVFFFGGDEFVSVYSCAAQKGRNGLSSILLVATLQSSLGLVTRRKKKAFILLSTPSSLLCQLKQLTTSSSVLSRVLTQL